MGCGSSKQATGATVGGGGGGGKGAGKEQKRNPSLHGNLVKDDNRKVEENYELENEIGKGRATEIVMAKSKKYHIKTKNSTAGMYAIKLYNGKSDEPPPQLGKEAAILLDCDHPNIVKLYELAKINKRLSLVLECCTGGSLADRFPYKEEDASRILRQLLSAVAYLHHRKIVHRDIELTNILFEDAEDNADIKLIDFGCATRLDEHPEKPGVFRALTEKTGSVHAMAPEVLQGRYSSKADVWAVGVCAYMLLMEGKKPFDGDTVEEMEASILRGNPSYTGFAHSKACLHFVKGCLDEDASTRPTAAAALKHDWITASRPQPMLPNNLVISFDLYGRSSPIKRVALNVLARKAAHKSVSQYRQLFRDLDVNQSGTLTKEEFLNGFAKSGSSQEELEVLFKKLDVNCNNEIMYTEFLAATVEASGEVEQAQLQEAFDLLDEDQSGVISKKNLLKMLGDSAAVKASVTEMLEGHDDLDFDDFQEMFQSGATSHNIDTIMEGDEE